MSRPYGDGRLAGEPPKPTGFRRRPAPREGYSRQYTDDRLARQAEEEQARARNAAENERLHNERLGKLDAERQAKRAENEKAFEAEIAAEHKARLERAWLADHPGETATAFEVEAWPHLLTNLKEQARAEAAEELRRQYRREYSSALDFGL